MNKVNMNKENMKKEYVSPKMQVVTLSRVTLLSGSPGLDDDDANRYYPAL